MQLTLEWLEEHKACEDSIPLFKASQERDVLCIFGMLLDGTGDAAELDKVERLGWANWLIVELLDRENRIRYAVFAARQVLHIYEDQFPGDDRPRKAIEAAEAVIESEDDCRGNVDAAWSAAWSARSAAWSAWSAGNEVFTLIIRYGISLLPDEF